MTSARDATLSRKSPCTAEVTVDAPGLTRLALEPVISRLAHDFCPLAPDIARRPGVVRLFTGLTVLWAGAHLLTAFAIPFLRESGNRS
jgi:hypothetical protein